MRRPAPSPILDPVLGSAVLVLIVSVASLPDPGPPPCEAKAADLLARVRDRLDKKRARMIELAVRRDPSILCGAVEQSFFASAPEVPKGCTVDRILACKSLQRIELPKGFERDVDPVFYLRIQTIAARLDGMRLFTGTHRALLETWLSAAAKSARAEREHHH